MLGFRPYRLYGRAGGTEADQLTYCRTALRIEALHESTAKAFTSLLDQEQRTLLHEIEAEARLTNSIVFTEEISAEARSLLTNQPMPTGVILVPIDPKTGDRDPNYGREE